MSPGKRTASVGSGIPDLIFDYLLALELQREIQEGYLDSSVLPRTNISLLRQSCTVGFGDTSPPKRALVAFGGVCRSWYHIYIRWRFWSLTFESSMWAASDHFFKLVRSNDLVASSIRRLVLIGSQDAQSTKPDHEPELHINSSVPTHFKDHSLAIPFIDTLLPLTPNLNELVLNVAHGGSAQASAQLHNHLVSLKNLTSFTFALTDLSWRKRTPLSTGRTLTSVLSGMCSLRNLKSLELEWDSAAPPELPRHTFPHFDLTSLVLSNLEFTDSHLDWLTSSTSSLHTIRLRHLRRVTPDGITRLLKRYSDTLHSVQLDLCKSAKDVNLGPVDPVLEALAGVKILSVEGTLFTRHLLDRIPLSINKTLTHLRLGSVGGDTVQPSAVLSFLRRATAVEELDIGTELSSTLANLRSHSLRREEVKKLAAARGVRVNGFLRGW